MGAVASLRGCSTRNSPARSASPFVALHTPSWNVCTDSARYGLSRHINIVVVAAANPFLLLLSSFLFLHSSFLLPVSSSLLPVSSFLFPPSSFQLPPPTSLFHLTSSFSPPSLSIPCPGIATSNDSKSQALNPTLQGCIEKYLRLGQKECPKCRLKVSSRRALRPDPQFDTLIQSFVRYPSTHSVETFWV